MGRLEAWLLGSLAICWLAPAAACAEARFYALGDLAGGDFHSRGRAISDDLRFVTGFSSAAGGTEAFRWSLAVGMLGIGELPGGPPSYNSEPFGISADGSQIGGQSTIGAGLFSSFLWTAGQDMVDIGELPGGAVHSLMHGLSADGTAGGGESISGNGPEAYYWTATGGMVPVGDLPGGDFGSWGHAISDDGSTVVGHSSVEGGSEAFRFRVAGGIQGLGFLAPDPALRFSRADGVNGDGDLVVGRSATAAGIVAFGWTPGTGMVSLGDLPGGSVYSRAIGASGDGSVIVGESEGPLGLQAVLWTPAEGIIALQTLLLARGVDLTGWVLESAWGVSTDGRAVTGHGINPSGNAEAFLAILDAPPIPAVPGWVSFLCAAAVLMSATLASLLIRARAAPGATRARAAAP